MERAIKETFQRRTLRILLRLTRSIKGFIPAGTSLDCVGEYTRIKVGFKNKRKKSLVEKTKKERVVPGIVGHKEGAEHPADAECYICKKKKKKIKKGRNANISLTKISFSRLMAIVPLD